MAKDSRTPDDYFTLSKSDRQRYDNQASHRIIATLMIQGCKYPSLRQWLVNQQLASGDDSAYPKTSNDAVRLIDNGTWGEEQGAPSNGNNGKHQGSNNGGGGNSGRQNQKSNNDKVAGSHVH